MKRLSFYVETFNISSTSVKEQAYKPLIRPSLSMVVIPRTEINQLEMVQRRAAINVCRQ